jgi:hypothetical protein
MGVERQQEDREGISGGRFVNPGILPPTRAFRLQKEPGVDMPYHFGQSYNINGISAVTVGTTWLNTIEFLYPWNSETRVTAVPAGERFDIVVNYLATNTVGGLTDAWAICIVFWENAGSTLDGYYLRSGSSTVINQNYARVANNYSLIMPAHNVVMNFNIFYNDDHGAQIPPARNVWASVR